MANTASEREAGPDDRMIPAGKPFPMLQRIARTWGYPSNLWETFPTPDLTTDLNIGIWARPYLGIEEKKILHTSFTSHLPIASPAIADFWCFRRKQGRKKNKLRLYLASCRGGGQGRSGTPSWPFRVNPEACDFYHYCLNAELQVSWAWWRRYRHPCSFQGPPW